MEQLLGAYGGASDSEDDEQELSAPSAPPARPTVPPHVESVQPRDEVQMGCPFRLGQRVHDDVFGREGVVLQLPLESEAQNRGKVLVKLDGEPGNPIWRTWGHCTLRAAVAATSTGPAPTQRPPGAGLQRPRDEPASEEPGPPAQKPKLQGVTIKNFLVRSRDSVPAASGARSAAPDCGATSSGPRASPLVSGAATGGTRSSTPAATSAGPSDEPAAADVPNMSSIERDRKLKVKPASEGKREDNVRGPAAQGRKYPIAKLQSRIAEFPDAPFLICKGKLRCTACECDVTATRKFQIEQHLLTNKHQSNTKKQERRKERDDGVMQNLEEFFRNNPNAVGATVDREVQMYRFHVTAALLAAGIALYKADALRNLLQRSCHALTDSSHLRSLVPLVEQHEIEQIRKDLAEKHVCIGYDGTGRMGEAVAITGRYLSEHFEIQMRLLAFVTLAKNYDASSLVRLLNPILMQHLQIKSDMVAGFAHDSAACNGLAMQTLSVLYGSSVDLPCVSHTLTHVGARFQFDELDTFMTPWYTLVCNSTQAKSLWKEMIGESVNGYSNVRWYCKAEIMMQIARHFDKLPLFLERLAEREIGDVTTTKMLTSYRSSKAELRLSFAAMLDMRPLVATTYKLEGDRLEILLAYDMLEALRSLGRRLGEPGTLQNVDCVLRQDMQIKKGVKISKLWDGMPFEGKVIEISTAESTIYPGQERRVYKVHYAADDTAEDLEDEEIRKLLVITELEVSAVRATALQHAHPCTCMLRVTLQLTSPYRHSPIATHPSIATRPCSLAGR